MQHSEPLLSKVSRHKRPHLVGSRFGGDAVEPEKSIKDRTCRRWSLQDAARTQRRSPGSQDTAATLDATSTGLPSGTEDQFHTSIL